MLEPPCVDSELSDLLALCVELTEDGLPLAREEIIEWYSVLSILACSFPTQRELYDETAFPIVESVVEG